MDEFRRNKESNSAENADSWELVRFSQRKQLIFY